MKMHLISKSLGYRTSHRFCGALFCMAAFSMCVATVTSGQTKSITPDPYFAGSQSTPSPIKKPADLLSGWKAPLNHELDSGSTTNGVERLQSPELRPSFPVLI